MRECIVGFIYFKILLDKLSKVLTVRYKHNMLCYLKQAKKLRTLAKVLKSQK